MAGFTKAFRQAVKWLAWVGTLTGLLSSSALVYAQGCAMCYTSASAAKAGAIHALRSGILILMVPVLVMCAGISVVIYRSRNRFSNTANWSAERDWELPEMLHWMSGVARPDLRENSLPSVVRGNSPRDKGPLTTDN